MRDAPASIDTMLAGRTFTLARCVKIQLRDYTEYGFTDLDEDIEIALSTDIYTPLTYKSGEGVLPSDIDLSAGLEADNTELVIPLGASITRAAVLGRRFNQAKVWIFDIDHSQAVPELLAMMKGTITEARIEEGKAVLEVRSQADFWNVTIGSVMTPRCRADFGDTQCGKVPEIATGTILSVTSDMVFQTSLGGLYADQYFRFGEIEFMTGDLADLPAREVVNYTGTTGALEIFDPLSTMPAVGDHFLMSRGCSRLKSSTDASVPTCLSYNNVTRFRGFDRVPGSDVYLKIAAPGDGGA